MTTTNEYSDLVLAMKQGQQQRAQRAQLSGLGAGGLAGWITSAQAPITAQWHPPQKRLFFRINEPGFGIKEPLDELRYKVAKWLA